MLQINRRRRHRGFTLTEIAIVLGIMGLIIGAVWTAASGTRNAQKNNDAVTELQTIVGNVSSMLLGQSLGAPVLTNATTSLNTAGAVTSAYYTSGSSYGTTPFGGASAFAVWENPTATPSRVFRMSFYNVTMSGCIALLTQGTACQANQVGCPTKVGTGGGPAPTVPTAAHSCSPSVACQGGAVTSGWGVLTVTAAQTLCGFNTYPSATVNSVEFDYSL